MLRKTWYVSCSPRNPEKIAPELALFATLQGKRWNETANGRKKVQLEFSHLLETCPTFEGSISDKDPAFSARDRVKPYKTFGFAYIDPKGKIVITPAGRRLISGVRPKEVFLKQLLKWQYPSFQHRGKEYEMEKPNRFFTLPFVDTLAVIRKIGGLTKREIAMFMLPKIRMGNVNQTTDMIGGFREKLGKIKGRVPRKRFIQTSHFNIYKALYRDKVRYMKKREAVEEVWKKVRNSMDVADATIRHFRYTGLLTVKEAYLSVPESRIRDVDAILSMRLRPVNFYPDVVKFYRYIGDPDIPVLPFESSEEFVKRAIAAYDYVVKTKSKYPTEPIAIPVIKDWSEIKALPLDEIKDILDSLETVKLKVEKMVFEEQVKFMDRAMIIEMYDKILAGEEEVFDPPVYFEWNTYRAIVAIDNAIVLPNFVMDEDHQPVSHAAGNKPDLIAEFDDFVVVTEVTLQTGKRQYMVEREPVVDHVGSYQKEEYSRKSPRNVFGLFIAPKVVSNTVNYFFISAKTDTEEYGGRVLVIPIELGEFIDLIKFSGQVEKFTQDDIKQLMLRFSKAFEEAKKPSDWRKLLMDYMEDWKRSVIIDHK